MAPTSTNTTSSIGHALAGMTESVKIPTPRDPNFWSGKDSFAAVAARSAPTKKHAAGLPTPPNSISPSLPPHAFKGLNQVATRGPPTPPGPVQLDSDIDLDDAVEHAKAQNSPHRGLTARRLGQLDELEAAGNITPSLLAKHHLPGILLDNGPLAIRHVMGFLTTSVPGFSGIAPAKARRLVVGALERHGTDGQQGGVNGDVIFEKVGWGRWDARKRGQPRREHTPTRHSSPARGLRIPSHGVRKHRNKAVEAHSGSYQDSDMGYDTAGDGASALEHEAEKMSLDSSSNKSSEYERPRLEDLPGEVTDEEDWASIGAAALRQGSLPGAGVMPTTSRSRSYQQQSDPRHRVRGASGARSSPKTSIAKSAPVTKHLFMEARRQHQLQHQRSPAIIPEDELRMGNAQDREAVEALLKLSSF